MRDEGRFTSGLTAKLERPTGESNLNMTKKNRFQVHHHTSGVINDVPAHMFDQLFAKVPTCLMKDGQDHQRGIPSHEH